MPLQLYNTLSRKKESFKPIKKGFVSIYSCGPTVYGNQHIGNMYAYIQWDVLVRFLKYSGYKTKWVMNITDVGHLTSDQDEGEDKMEKGAKKEGLSVWKIAEKYIEQFLASMDALDIKRPSILCQATKHIKEQIDLIKMIEEKGFAYKTSTGLVFDTSKFKDYAKFAKLNLKKQYAGARTKIDREKKQPWDFILWITNQPNHIMQWDSPWGKGFPGWHIECTAMSTKYLGNKFDIHTGGKEHIPVHHTNEIAQGFGAFGSSNTANYWLHNEWLLFEKTKISKSLGNVILVNNLQEKGFDPLAFRYLAFTAHYKKGLNFTWKGLEASQNAYERINTIIAKEDDKKINKKYLKEFVEAINDDLNTSKALSVLWNLLRDKKAYGKRKTVLEMDKVLGLDLKPEIIVRVIPGYVLDAIKQRERYRQEKKWDLADKIRKEIESNGYTIEDTGKGPMVKRLR